jgi:XapX domain-containing protein
MLKLPMGFFLGFLFGAICRWFDVPAPSPPKLFGALLVVSVTLGNVGADRMMSNANTHTASQFVDRVWNEDDCGASGAVDTPLKIRQSGSVITSIAALVRIFCPAYSLN